MEILQYKDYEGSAELDMQRQVCRGKILHIGDLVTYESANIQGLQKQFEEAVDDYIETCNAIGKTPQKSYKGQFNVRVSAELHRLAARKALVNDTTLNEVVVQALQHYLNGGDASASVLAHHVVISQLPGDPAAATVEQNPAYVLPMRSALQSKDPAAAERVPVQVWTSYGSSAAVLDAQEDKNHVH